jgi:hypothetical protein
MPATGATFTGAYEGVIQQGTLTDGVSYSMAAQAQTTTITDIVSGHSSFVVGDNVSLSTTGFSPPAAGTYTYVGYVTINTVKYPVIKTGSNFTVIGAPATVTTTLIAGVPFTATTIPNGTFHAADMACFVTGTRIRTERGDIAVEDLRAGVDRVITAEGRVAPILWIGHRAADPLSTDDRPVRLRAHCIGPDLPARDLLVSPEHAIFLDGALYPAASLLNPHSIIRADLASVTYFHILLDRHDIILAEGLPTESFLPNDNWDQFDNASRADCFHPESDGGFPDAGVM